MTKERLTLYDTTLRDGQQTQGVDFSVEAKQRIASELDALGIDYIEGGWPGANPTDSDFFRSPPKLKRARFAAFGMTKRIGISASNDPVLAEVLDAGTASVCLVGKTHDFHVREALGAELDENVAAIHESLTHVAGQGREALFDAEHFFDGYKANPSYALECLDAAFQAGARWIVLCDTNGGATPSEVREIVDTVCRRIPGDRIGIHTHNDAELAVANTLAAVEAGARQIQGTLNGLGERCGNANLVSLIPTLLLKEPYASQFEIGVTVEGLAGVTRLSRLLDDILNRPPDRHAPYVGAAAFAHKAGLHASAIAKHPSTYEHIEPGLVGNERVIPMSNQAGRSNLRQRLVEAGIKVAADDPKLGELLTLVKQREDQGFAYDSAAASFELLAHRFLGTLPRFFEVEQYRIIVERRFNALNEIVTVSEAVARTRENGSVRTSFFESTNGGRQADQGPVDALYHALRQDLGRYQSYIEQMRLVDYRVRILTSGTEAVTRVLIDSLDEETGATWSTVGVSANIVDASFQALSDAITYKLMRSGAPASIS
ncbi:MAG: citramalate synthase [Pseudomonadota bacterium]